MRCTPTAGGYRTARSWRRQRSLPCPSSRCRSRQPPSTAIIGRPRRVVDAEEIVTGRARYGIDVYEPEARTAVMLRCPYFDGGIARLDDSAARAVPGVRAVVVVPGPKPGEPFTANLATGVAVVADDTWSALKGRNALKVEWTRGPFAAESSAALDAQCAELLAKRGQVVHDDGDFDAASRDAARVVKARYRIPFVSHSPLEAPCAFVHVQADRARVVAALQQPGGASRAVHTVTGIPRAAISVEMTRAGGGFGRRLTNDFVAEAALVSKADRLAGQARVDALGRPAARLLPALRPPRDSWQRSALTEASPAGRIGSRVRRSTTVART